MPSRNLSKLRQRKALSPKSSQQVAKYLRKRRFDLLEDWLGRLYEGQGRNDAAKRHQRIVEFKKGEDLVTVALGLLESGEHQELPEIDSVLKCLRRPNYSIVDLSGDIEELRRSVKEILQNSGEVSEQHQKAAVIHLSNQFKRLFTDALKWTSEVYEFVLETGKSGFCHTDQHGKIIFANECFRKLVGKETLIGKPLKDFFSGEDETLIRKSLVPYSGSEASPPTILALNRRHGSERVIAEIRQIIIDGRNRGTYAVITPISDQFYLDVFDSLPWGVAWLTPKGKSGEVEFRYANKRALEIFGAQHIAHLKISKLIPSGRNSRKFKDEIAARREGKSGDYILTIHPLNKRNRRKIVHIAASGMLGPRGDYVASFAIIQDVTDREVTKKLYRYIEDTRDPQDILHKTYRLLTQIFDFDLLAIGIYSADLRHWAPIYTEGSGEKFVWQTRWFELNEVMSNWNADRTNVLIEDFESFITRPEFGILRDEPDVKRMLDLGIKSMMRLPVIEDNRVVASITLLSKQRAAFSLEDYDVMSQIPLDKALIVVLHLLNQREINYRLSLMKDLSKSRSLGDFATVLTKSLVEHYGWQHAALFRVLRDGRGFKMISQETHGVAPPPLEAGYVQPLDVGILGRTYAAGKTILLGNVTEEADYQSLYPGKNGKGKDETVIHSELCVPLLQGRRISWLINVEDSRMNAFSLEDRENLEEVAKQLNNLLYSISDRYFLNTVFDSTSDAVIVTDRNSRILRLNTAARSILGYGAEDRVRGRFEGRFVDPADTVEVLASDGRFNKKLELKRRDGSNIPVVLSGRWLPEELGGKVFVAADWSLETRLEELRGLAAVHHEVAQQAKLPLALASTWLDRLVTETDPAVRAGYATRITRELHKVDFTLDRLAYYDLRESELFANRIPIKFSHIVERIGDEYDSDGWSIIKVDKEPSEPYVLGDPSLTTFVLQSIISYFLRATPRNEKVLVRLEPLKGMYSIALTGFFPNEKQLSYLAQEADREIINAVSELVLSEKSMQRIISAHKGRMEVQTEGVKRMYRISLGIAEAA